MSKLQSLGRGGAGNIADVSKSPQLLAQDLDTPTLKSSVVTTGRGGSGNMAKNVDAAETRALQDVEPFSAAEVDHNDEIGFVADIINRVVRRPSHGAHSGRGGAGNVLSSEDAKKADHGSAIVDSDRSQEKGWAEKGKDLLFGKK